MKFFCHNCHHYESGMYCYVKIKEYKECHYSRVPCYYTHRELNGDNNCAYFTVPYGFFGKLRSWWRRMDYRHVPMKGDYNAK